MKIALSVGVLFGSLALVSAGTTNIYVEDWGTTVGGSSVNGNGNLNTVGWTGVAVSQTAGPYLGIYQATGASDPASGAALPANTVYFTTLSPTQTTPGMIYTTDTAGPGTGGDSSFVDVNPAKYTNLMLSVEVRGAATDTNYFAIQQGGTWYVSTTQLPGSGNLGYPQFTNDSVPYTNLASAWKTLTINATDVTIGSTPAGNLSGNITGIGIVELPTSGGFNYNQLAISAFAPSTNVVIGATITAPAISQTVYAGGGASFLIQAAGTPPLTYIWQANGVTLHDGAKYTGTTNNVLTVLNATSDDAGAIYSVTVTNSGGGQSESGIGLTVNPLPSGDLYAESFPYVGPNGNLPITGVGWQGIFQGSTGIYQSGTGVGNVFSYSGVATTNLYYTTVTNDTGASGVPFTAIDPTSVPHVTLQADITPGNAGGTSPAGNVIAYWAVQMSDGNWYVSAQAIPVQTITQGNFQLYQLGFSPAASSWNTLTLGANTTTIGAHPAGPLTGSIIGAGIVIAHQGLNGGGDFNFNNFAITENAVTIQPVDLSAGYPLNQTVYTGGGASFGQNPAGQSPFTYGWTLNGAPLVNGARVFGATTPTVTIANLKPSDSGSIVAFASNSVSFDESDNYVGTSLSVVDRPAGTIYAETFPFVGPASGNYPLSSVGWVEAVNNSPNALFQNIGGDGAVFAYLGVPGTTVYYTTVASDTNQAGLAFPYIDAAAYSDLAFSVDVAPSFQAANVTAYWAVQMDNSNWYVSSAALPTPTSDTSTYSTYTAAFSPAASNWKNLTVTSAGGLIGAPASSALRGSITGAGLVFVTVGSGGNMNFDNFIITGSGVGGLTVGPMSNGNVTFYWAGNPAVNLQSASSLTTPISWQDVPNTAGAYSITVPASGQKFYRIVQHP
ncbi:MAG TPA: immunoglobulin domain-containing protein [Verrucomicrobiae bacterium]|jgi:hypothetical protein|nr:immunoglobulin domain-containing protein [Verrucomicrobiae bacterium]